eukprot:362866-Chlamydomonas_euryale.AAC.37
MLMRLTASRTGEPLKKGTTCVKLKPASTTTPAPACGLKRGLWRYHCVCNIRTHNVQDGVSPKGHRRHMWCTIGVIAQ